jgi:cytoskeletal protein RodZ
MAKSNKLFTEDDFSKDGGKKFPWWIVIALLAVAIIVALFLLLKKGKSEPTQPEPVQVEQVASIPETTPSPDEATVASTDNVSTTQEAPKADAPKVEEQKQTTSNQYSGDLSILNGKTLKEKANVVIRGYFGNNPERKRTLGDAYREIQDKVNEMYRNGEVR